MDYGAFFFGRCLSSMKLASAIATKVKGAGPSKKSSATRDERQGLCNSRESFVLVASMLNTFTRSKKKPPTR